MEIVISPAFSPGLALVGGALIGTSAVILMGVNGKIFGISSIAAGVLPDNQMADKDWRLAFLAGIVGASSVLVNVFPAGFSPAPGSITMIALGALLVGFGSRLGAGCTSGHGVSGLSRLSRRSFAAVGTFFTSAYLTTVFVRPALDAALAPLSPALPLTVPVPFFSTIVAASAALMLSRALTQPGPSSWAMRMAGFCAGATAASGLVLSGMSNPNKVLTFFNFFPGATWDPSLALVMIPAIAITMTGYRLIPKLMDKPVAGHKFDWPTATEITSNLVLGSALFGVGWSLSGGCPGPILVGVASGLSSSLVAFGFLMLGKYIYENLRPMLGPS